MIKYLVELGQNPRVIRSKKEIIELGNDGSFRFRFIQFKARFYYIKIEKAGYNNILSKNFKITKGYYEFKNPFILV